jgi:hypothetical protein
MSGESSGVKHYIIFHLFQIGFIPSFINETTINIVKLIDPVIIKRLIESRKIQESLSDCVVDLCLSHCDSDNKLFGDVHTYSFTNRVRNCDPFVVSFMEINHVFSSIAMFDPAMLLCEFLKLLGGHVGFGSFPSQHGQDTRP